MTPDEYSRTLAHGQDVTFKTPRSKMLLALVGCVAFTIVGLCMVGSEGIKVQIFGWLAVLFFGVFGIPRTLYMTIRPRVQLKVSAEHGVWLRQRGGTRVPWDAISSVETTTINGESVDGLVADPELIEFEKEAGLVSWSVPGDDGTELVALPKNLTVDPLDLLEWLTAEVEYRSRAVRR